MAEGATKASSPAAIARRAAAALVIRRAAAPLLLHGIVDTHAWTRAAAADADAWRLFLRVERCALPLRRALTTARLASPPDAPFHAQLAQAARREAARVLVACAHLRTAAAIAAARGIAILVLKGGTLAAASEHAIELHDVDVLVPRHAMADVVDGLKAAGSVETGLTSERVGQSLLSNDMQIEVHDTLGDEASEVDDGLFERSEPLAAVPPLRQLGAYDNLRHVVEHLAIGHPNRRLRLRDLLLVAHAARRCSPEYVASAFATPNANGANAGGAASDAAKRAGGAAAEAVYAARMCRATLDLAVRRPDGRVDPDPDLDRRILATYVLASRKRPKYLPVDVDEFVEFWSITMLQGPWERQQIWASARVHARGQSTRPFIRAIEQRSVRLGRLWRVTARTAYRAATWVVARPVAARTRRTVEQAMRGLSRDETT